MVLATQHAVLSLAAVTAPAPSSSGEHARVVVLPVEVLGDVDPLLRGEFDARVIAGLRRDDVVVVAPQEVAAAQPELEHCGAPACHRSVARRFDADYLLAAEISAIGRDFILRARLVDATSGVVVATSVESCDVCALGEVAGLLEDQAAATWGKLETLQIDAPALSIATQPSGARVEIDGTAVGRTPLRREVEPGPHVARVLAPGYAAQEFRFTSVPGFTEELSFPLVPVQRRDPSRPYRIAGPTTLAVGGALLAGGISLLVLHDRDWRSRCNGSDIDADGDCRYRYETLAGGLTLSLLGTGAAISGLVVWVIGAQRRPRSPVGGALAEGRF